MASAGTLYVDVLPDTRYFGMALRTSMNRAVAGSTLKNLGSIMSRGMVVGAAAAGAAAVKMALDFNQSMTRIQALTNTSNKDMKKYQDTVMQLSHETARSPKELADALYFVASAGLRANEVLPTLKASAEGAAIGLGSTGDVSRIVVSALNAYADSGLTATHVMDILTAATREGTAAPEEFATSLGRILPIASQAGVSFDQVAASLATVSNIGLNVYEGTTAMRGVLQSIVAPTKTAAATMAQYGLSGAALRDVLTKKGLLAAMRLLYDRTHGNMDAMKAIIPNIRALVGELGNVGQAADKVNGIYKRVKNSTGDLGDAMKTTAASPAFQFRQALTDMSNVLLDLGEHLLPSVLHAVQDLVPVLKFAADNAALLVSAFAGFKALRWLPGMFEAIASAIGPLAASTLGEALGPVAILPQLIQDNMHGIKATFGIGNEKVVSAEQMNTGDAKILFDLYKTGALNLNEFAAGMRQANERANDLRFTHWTKDQTTALAGFEKAIGDKPGVLNALGNELAGNNEAFSQAEDMILGYNKAQVSGSDITKMYTEYQKGLTKAMNDQAKAARKAQVGSHVKSQLGQAQNVIANFGQVAGKALDIGALGKLPMDQMLQSVGASWDALSAKIGGSINGIFTGLEGLTNKTKVSFGDVQKAVSGSIADMKRFGSDLAKIGADAKRGIPGAKDLLNELIQMGPAGVHVADAIAGASPKARRALEREIGGGMKAVKSVSDRVTQALVGSMEHVAAAILVATGQAQTFQQALQMLHSVDINIGANTDPAYTAVNDFIAWANSQTAHPTLVMDQSTALHGRAPGTQAGGPVYTTRSTWVGERGPELFVPNMPGRIIPNPDPSNWGLSHQGTHGTMTLIKGTLSIDESGQAFIRGIARDETNSELRYRRIG